MPYLRCILVCCVIVFSIPCLLSGGTVATSGTEFWLCFMENRTDIGNPPPDFEIIIGSAVDTEGEVSMPLTGWSASFTVAAGGVARVPLPAAAVNVSGSERIEGRGIRVTAAAPVTVTAMHYRVYFSDASIVLPVERLGSRYRVLAATDYQGISPSAFALVAIEDGTELEIIPTAVTEGVRPAGQPFTVTLNRGEAYQVKARSDLTGSSVRSVNGRPFALFGGAQAARIDCDADNHVFDQIAPLNDWGRVYLALPFNRRRDLFKIVAAEDSTTLKLDCGTPVTLDAGEVHSVFLRSPTLISADRPVAVAQISLGQLCGGSQGDPSMLVLAPLSHRTRYVPFLSPRKTHASNPGRLYFAEHFINLACNTDDVSDVRLDGVSIASEFRPLPADPGYSWAVVDVGEGTHLLTAPGGVAAFAYGFGEFDAYTCELGADTVRFIGDVPTQKYLSLQAGFSIRGCDSMTGDGGLCVGLPVDFSLEDESGDAAVRWEFGDGEAAVGRDVAHTYDEPGEYRVRLSLLGPDCRELVSEQAVRVGICRSDLDVWLRPAPNPLIGTLKLTYAVRKATEVSFEVHDAAGAARVLLDAAVREPGIYEEVYDLEGLPVGVYFLKGRFGDREVVEKIVKVR